MPHTIDDDFAMLLDETEPEVKDREEVESLVGHMIEQAIQWREEFLDPVQEKATDYYLGEPFGDEQAGRSKVVLTTVRDAVQAVLPSFMRVFFGSERVVEFRPDNAEDIPIAKQQTEYINYIFVEDNPGFKILHSVLKDALVRKMGIVKYWWEEREKVLGSEHTGLTADQIAILAQEPGLEIELLEDVDDEEFLQATSQTFDVEVRRIETEGRARVAAVPPEEFIFSPSARCLEDAKLVGHVREVPADELISMGFDPDIIDHAKGPGRERLGSDTLSAARKIDKGDRFGAEDEQDEATRPVPFAEVYVRLDEDGDGISELHKIQAVGNDWEIVDDEVVDEAPFALFMPDPEPHTIVGLSLADYVMDLQRITSAIARGMLDSLTLSLNPATEVVEGEVNMKDVLNTEVGRIIRVRKPGMMREVETPFVGQSALPVLQYFDTVKEDRTGRSRAASGLDPDALQSSTRAAVSATVEAAKERTELFARIFAETGMTDLFRGLLRLVVRHQDQPRVVRLRNEFVPVDPKHWDADKDVTVNVALGTGLVEEKLQMLALIAEKQEQHLQQGSPIVTLSQLRSTYSRMVELLGFKNPEEFFQPFGPEQDQQFAQAQAQSAQEPDPETKTLAQVEMAKIQAKAQVDQAEIQLKIAELQLEREKLARELGIKEADVDRKARKDQTDAAIERARQDLEAVKAVPEAAKTLSETKINLGEGES